jgi:hypothetical protein
MNVSYVTYYFCQIVPHQSTLHEQKSVEMNGLSVTYIVPRQLTLHEQQEEQKSGCPQRKSIVAGGGFETRLPERLPI